MCLNVGHTVLVIYLCSPQHIAIVLVCYNSAVSPTLTFTLVQIEKPETTLNRLHSTNYSIVIQTAIHSSNTNNKLFALAERTTPNCFPFDQHSSSTKKRSCIRKPDCYCHRYFVDCHEWSHPIIRQQRIMIMITDHHKQHLSL